MKTKPRKRRNFEPSSPMTSRGSSTLDRSSYPHLQKEDFERIAREATGPADMGGREDGIDDLPGTNGTFKARPTPPAVPTPDPLEAALEAARGLPWWDSKVEAKAVAVPADVWSHFLVADPAYRKKLHKALSKFRTWNPEARREENKRRAAREKAALAATRPARLAQAEADLTALRVEEGKHRAIMDECVLALPDRNKPPVERSPIFGSKHADLGVRYRAALRSLLDLQARVRRLLNQRAAMMKALST